MGNLSPWLMLVIGILIGWLLAWVLDRGDKQKLTHRVTQLERDLQTRANDLSECHSRAAAQEQSHRLQIDRLQAEAAACASELATRDAALVALQQTLADSEAAAAAGLAATRAAIDELDLVDVEIIDLGPLRVETVEVEFDDFTKIKGIGPAYAARLGDAGVLSYADLAAIDPPALATLAGVRNWQKVDTDEWVVEAKRLANHPRTIHVGDDLTQIVGIGPSYATRLRAAGIINFGQLAASDAATLNDIIGAPAWRRLDYASWIAQAKLASAGDEPALRALQIDLTGPKRDNLGLVHGVGAQSVDVLENGGITTYADLANATPEQLHALFTAAGVRAGDFDAWIAEAKLRAAGTRVPRKATRTRPVPTGAVQSRACPQDLEQILGVGRVYEQRLYDVGIGSFWEVGMLADEELIDILEIKEFQDVDLAEIKADALRLAEATDTMGHTWDGTEPDDFDILAGIGPVLERRLYAAGICTYEALASSTVEMLEQIATLPAFQSPDFQAWIAQARAEVQH